MFISTNNRPHQNMPRLQTHFWRQTQKHRLYNPRHGSHKYIYCWLIQQRAHHYISMPVLESGKHTHKHSPHPLARVHFSFTCCNQQLCVSTRKAENSAGIAHTHSSFTHKNPFV